MSSPSGTLNQDLERKTVVALYRFCICAAITLSLLLVAGIWHLGANSMIACGFLGAVFIHAASRPGWKRMLFAALVGMAFAVVYVLLKGVVATDAFARAMGMGAFWGIGSIVVLSFEMVIYGKRENLRFLSDALVLPVFSLVAGIGMQLTNGLTHASYDNLLYAFDTSLGIAPGLRVISWCRAAPWIATASGLVYAGLLIFPPLYHAWALHKVRTEKYNLMHVFVIAGICGFVFYQICPAMGPLYLFESKFPDHLPALVPLQAFSSTGVNNAMPSMHMTWALLVWWSAWELGPVALGIASAVVGFTGLATLGSGEHYLIDLIVAVPLAMAVNGIYRRSWSRAIAGVAMVVGWTVYLRMGLWTGVAATLHWMLIAVTLVVALIFTRVTRSRL